MTDQTISERRPTMAWHLAQTGGAAERRVMIALRQRRFTMYRPTETKVKALPKGKTENVEHPLFPGYLFVATDSTHPYDAFHEIPGLRIIPTNWPAAAFAAMVCDFAFRQLAGEFDRTGSKPYLPAKPMAGPLTHTVGHGLSALEKLKATDERGRVRLLLAGDLVDGGEPVEQMDEAA